MNQHTNGPLGDGMDSLLDAALEHYSSAEPRPGFEQRLLARLREAPASSPLWRWHFVVPAALAVCLGAVALYVSLRSSSPGLSPVGPDVAHVSPEVPKIAPDAQGQDGRDAGPDSSTAVAAIPPSPESGGLGESHQPLRADVRVPLTQPLRAENQEDLLFEFLQSPASLPSLRELRQTRSAPLGEIAGLDIPELSIEFLPGFVPEDAEKGE